MRNLADASLFNLVDRLVGKANPGQKLDCWRYDDSEWQRERHTFAGQTHSFSITTTIVRALKAPSWRLFVVREMWWGSDRKDALKTLQWAKTVAGRPADVLRWLHEQQRILDK